MSKPDIDDLLNKAILDSTDDKKTNKQIRDEAKQALYQRLAAEAEPLGLWGNDLAIPISRLKAIMEIKEL